MISKMENMLDFKINLFSGENEINQISREVSIVNYRIIGLIQKDCKKT